MEREYKFNEDWFSGNIPAWKQIINHVQQEKEIKDILEVGAYEGRCTVFLSEEVLGKGCTYTVVDTFGGSAEEKGMKSVMDRLEKEDDYIYNNFMHNISHFPDIDYTVHRGNSEYVLPKLAEEDKQYDMIYVDGSHMADTTLVDGFYAHKMLRPGGLIIFDDFGWIDPNRTGINERPEFGVRAFVTMYEEQYEVIGHGYQLALVKKAEWATSESRLAPLS